MTGANVDRRDPPCLKHTAAARRQRRRIAAENCFAGELASLPTAEETLIDHVADLRHLADHLGVDFDGAVAQASWHHRLETAVE